ncbi:MAG: GntR family transcriptional regulator [Streptosporangiales bacterium]|nr:GntR family transcriptional regulator [Streptosporangiales bacterium]
MDQQEMQEMTENDLPLSRRIANDLRREIETGRYQPGDLLPSQTVLLTRYDVSKSTARRAFSFLIYERVVKAQHGRGHVVLRHPNAPHECRHCGATWRGDDGCDTAPGRDVGTQRKVAAEDMK